MRKSFLIRIDPQLWSELEAWSQEELRSVNGQIEYLLRQAVAQRRKGPPGVPGGPVEAPAASPPANPRHTIGTNTPDRTDLTEK